MAKAIGIDLGTTNSVMALQAKGLMILRNRENEEITRSAVSAHKGTIHVGNPAINFMPDNAKDTVISIKRLIGRAYSDPKVQETKEKKDFIFYEIVPPEDGTQESVRVVMGGKKYSPVEISAKILEKMRKDAATGLGEDVDYAVITVPAYFSEKQKDATRQAGWKAGLKVQRLLAEPTAAAVAYGINNLDPSEARTILVFDFGGGTLDISILQVVGSVFAEMAIDGDMWLGGDNFDELLVNAALQKVKDEYGIDVDRLPIPQERKDRFKIYLRLAVEKAKIMLSSSKAAPIVVVGALEDAQRNPINIDVEITRGEFERLIEPMVQQSMEKVQKALDKAKITPAQIDHVLLVGGSTSVPLVQRHLADFFGESKLMRNLDPMKCVAQGAGIMAAVLGEVKECPKCAHSNTAEDFQCQQCGYIFPVLGNVTGQAYGIQTAGDEFDPIIKAGRPYPSPQPEVRPYKTKRDNQRRIKIPVYRGENHTASLNELMRILWLSLPRGLPKGTRVEVGLALDGDDTLDRIGVKLLDGSGTPLQVVSDQGEGERVRLENDLEDLSKQWAERLPQADWGLASRMENLLDEIIDALNAEQFVAVRQKMSEFKELLATIGDTAATWKRRAENICSYAEVMMERFGFLIKAEDTYALNKLIEEVRSAVKAGKEEEAQPKVEQLDKRIDDTVPAYYLMVLTVLAIRAHDAGKLAESEAFKMVVNRAEEAARNNNQEAFQHQLDEGAKLIGGLDIPKPTADDGTVEKLRSSSH